MVWRFIKDLVDGILFSKYSIPVWLGFAPLLYFFVPVLWGVKMRIILKRAKSYAIHIFPWFIMVSVVLTSYSLYADKQRQIDKMQTDNTNSAKTKQAIRNFFKMVNPKIVNKIDTGEWAIWVRMGSSASNRLRELSKYPDFNSFFVVYKEADANETKFMEKSPFTIEELDKDDFGKCYYFLYPRSSLINEGN
jgi:hypothetical protein